MSDVEHPIIGVRIKQDGAWRDLTRDEIRTEMLTVLHTHDPAQQAGAPDAFAGRCMHCHYTRHPCDAWFAASLALWLLDEGRDATLESGAT